MGITTRAGGGQEGGRRGGQERRGEERRGGGMNEEERRVCGCGIASYREGNEKNSSPRSVSRAKSKQPVKVAVEDEMKCDTEGRKPMFSCRERNFTATQGAER
eukprot:751825-Hanusia_phi.AAC.3